MSGKRARRPAPHPREYIEPETLYEPPFGGARYGAPIDGDLCFDGSDERSYPGDDVDDGGVEDVEIERLPGD